MAFTLPDLPYAKDAFGDFISAETFDFHHGKHHNAYVTATNGQLADAGLEGASLSEVIGKAKASGNGKLFNAAAQIWNHSFYWNCLSPKGGEPGGALADAINKSFGSLDEFKQKFSQTAVTTFGSGWAWLVKNAAGDLEIISTSNAGCPLTEGKTPLLTCDVWEHAYYIDYRNARPKYVETFWKIVNWDFVAKNLGA